MRARRTLTGTTLVAIGLASGVVLAVLLVGAPTFSRLLLGSAEHAWTLRLLALNGFLQAFLCVPHSLLRIRNQPARFARWTVGGGLGAAAGRLLLVVGFRMGVFGIMLADLLASVVLVAGLSRVVERPIGRASWQRAREMLRFSLAAGPQHVAATGHHDVRPFLPAALPPAGGCRRLPVGRHHRQCPAHLSGSVPSCLDAVRLRDDGSTGRAAAVRPPRDGRLRSAGVWDGGDRHPRRAGGANHDPADVPWRRRGRALPGPGRRPAWRRRLPDDIAQRRESGRAPCQSPPPPLPRSP